MAMQGVSGLVSGINSAEIIDAMIASERQVAVQVEKRKAFAEAKLEAIRGLNTRMLEVDTDLFYLRRSSTFNARQVSVSDADVLSATANSSATLGTYRVRIDQLAQAEQRLTSSVAANTKVSGTLTLKVGAGSTWTHDFEDPTSLEDVAKAISSDPAAGVTAQVITDGNQRRLLLTGRNTGATNTLTIGGTLSDEVGDLFNGTTVVSTAQDAQATLRVGADAIQDLTVTSSTNRIENLLGGVTITAKETSADFIDLTVANDPNAAQERISGYIESLNAALDYFRANGTYDPATREAGVLFSENGLRLGLNGVIQAMISTPPGDTGSYSTLSAIGISYDQTTGKFSLDEATLSEALSSDPEGVRQLFVDSGLGEEINDQLKKMTDSVDGTLSAADDQTSKSIEDMTTRIKDIDDRLATRRTRYEAQFLAMEKMIASFKNQESMLLGQISGFENMAAARSQ